MADKIICKYKFQDKEKFSGKPYCTCFSELCEDLSFVCDHNCQIFEDYKQLIYKTQECEELKNKNKKISKYWIKSDEKLKEYKMALETTHGALQFYKQCSKEDENKLARKTQECEKLKNENKRLIGKISNCVVDEFEELDRCRKALENIEKIIKEYDCVNCSEQHCEDCNKSEIFYIINKAKGEG